MKPIIILTDETATVVVGTTPYVIAVGQPRWGPLLEAINANDDERVVEIVTEVSRLADSPIITDTALRIEAGRIYYGDAQLTGYLIDHILRTIRDGEDAQPFINFLANLQNNPSNRMVKGLFRWVEKGKMKITPDGLIVAYKKVRADFTDAWTGTMDNSIGARPWKRRNDINDEPDTTCADSGLHFCAKDYLPDFQSYGSNDHIMVIHVNPADVVSFPKNEAAKGRASTYLVVDMIPPGEDPDLYIRAGLRPGSDFVVETTNQTHPEPTTEPFDDSVGFKAWNALTDEERANYLLKLQAAEDQIGTSGPNLPARIRAAELELSLTPYDADLWLDRIDDIAIYADDFGDEYPEEED